MIVHGMGGIAGLTAAWVLGPRIGRYNDDGSANVIPGHSLTFAVLGTLILAFGWYGFNVGTSAILGEGFLGDQLGRVAVTTTISMAAGAMGAGLVAWYKTSKVDTLYVANGLLAGLAGITAIPHVATWWGAFVVGGLCGAQLPVVFRFVEKRLKIDDVCAVFPVHGSAGVLGTLLYPFVAAPQFVDSVVNTFIAQLIGVAVIAAWTVVATGLIWGAFKAMGQARVTPQHEQEGLDIAEHGVDTYPEFGVDDGVATDGGNMQTDGGIPSDVPAAHERGDSE
jgi:Amt family ammonium transporter